MANDTPNPLYHKQMAAISAPRWTYSDVAMIHGQLNSIKRLDHLETASAKIPFLDELCSIVDKTYNQIVFVYGLRVLGQHRLSREHGPKHAYNDATLQEKVESFRGRILDRSQFVPDWPFPQSPESNGTYTLERDRAKFIPE